MGSAPAATTKRTVADEIGTALDDLLTALGDALHAVDAFSMRESRCLQDAADTLSRYRFDRNRLVKAVEDMEHTTDGGAMTDVVDELESAVADIQAIAFGLRYKAEQVRRGA